MSVRHTGVMAEGDWSVSKTTFLAPPKTGDTTVTCLTCRGGQKIGLYFKDFSTTSDP